MLNWNNKLAIAGVCVVLGFMIVIQFKAVNQSVGTISEYRARELASQLKIVKEERDKLLEVKAKFETQISQFEESEAKGDSSALYVKEELEKARMLAGLEDVSGPGITIILDDLKFSEKYNYSLIEYNMILELVNELNAAGAETISINDQRIIATSEIREAGVHINVNTVKLAPPFTIKVIGDGKTLEAALRLRGGIVERIESGGVAVTISQGDNIVVLKYNGIIEPKYSQPIKGDVKK